VQFDFVEVLVEAVRIRAVTDVVKAGAQFKRDAKHRPAHTIALGDKRRDGSDSHAMIPARVISRIVSNKRQ
jgi:hypothetical protein